MSNEIVYKCFHEQAKFHSLRETHRRRGAFAGKRGGKTECGAVESIIYTDQQIGYKPNGIDPYLGVIIAPTYDMLRRLSLTKFFAYAKPWKYQFHQSRLEITWPENDSKIYCISADKPQRLEGVKANWIWIDEIFQIKEQLYLEAIARTSDTQGAIWCTGSLGVQYNNPKAHWAYQYFKKRPDKHTTSIEWPTINNPYFPRDEIEDLRESLDPRTFKQMFELDWNVPGTALVYDELDADNFISEFKLENYHRVFCCIDWGWTHPMACLFIAYNEQEDIVYIFDEIVQSKLNLPKLWEKIQEKGYRINQWICDIAGDQTREQTGISNIDWFRHEHNIKFKRRSTGIGYGIPLVRMYIKNGLGESKLLIHEENCPQTADQLRNYSYPEKDGIITNENPIKEDDDAPDSLRYFFVNELDEIIKRRKLRVSHYI